MIKDPCRNKTLKLNIRDYWHAGGGRGAGFQVDAIPETNPNGWPYLPGRTLKGLLRDAVQRAENFGQLKSILSAPLTNNDITITQLLFGSEGFYQGPDKEIIARDHTQRGALAISNAHLPKAVIDYCEQDPNLKTQQAHCFRSLYSTAINPTTGTAQNHSLRGMQVAVPMILEANIHWSVETSIQSDPTSLQAQQTLASLWPQLLEQAFPLLRGLGAQRTRGLGRVIVSWQEENPHEKS